MSFSSNIFKKEILTSTGISLPHVETILITFDNICGSMFQIKSNSFHFTFILWLVILSQTYSIYFLISMQREYKQKQNKSQRIFLQNITFIIGIIKIGKNGDYYKVKKLQNIICLEGKPKSIINLLTTNISVISKESDRNIIFNFKYQLF